jgi:hypothetical protein
MQDVVYNDYRIIAMSNQGEQYTVSEFDPFAVRITVKYSRTGDYSLSQVMGILISIVVVGVLWALSYV